MVINCTKFSLYLAYSVSRHAFLLCDNTTLSFDLRPWKSISIFLSFRWSILPSWLMVHSVSWLRFTIMWQYELDLSPLKQEATVIWHKYCQYGVKCYSINQSINQSVKPLMVFNCTKLYDPGSNDSFSVLLTTFSYYVTIRPLPLTLKNNRHLSFTYQVVRSWSLRFGLHAHYSRIDGQTDARRYYINIECTRG